MLPSIQNILDSTQQGPDSPPPTPHRLSSPLLPEPMLAKISTSPRDAPQAWPSAAQGAPAVGSVPMPLTPPFAPSQFSSSTSNTHRPYTTFPPSPSRKSDSYDDRLVPGLSSFDPETLTTNPATMSAASQDSPTSIVAPKGSGPSKSRGYSCTAPGCSAAFTRSEHLRRHQLTHTREKPYQCTWPSCGRRFNRQDNLLTHKRRHRDPPSIPVTSILALLNSGPSGDLPQNAPATSEPGKRAPKTSVSSRSRNKELKPFSCSQCGLRFGRLEHVRRHQLVHSKERPFECTICHKTFARNDNMLQHVRAHERRDTNKLVSVA